MNILKIIQIFSDADFDVTDYSKEEIDYAISKLNNYYIELLKLKFWKDFNISDNKRLDRHENKLFYTGVVRKVKKLIKEKN